MDKIQGVMGVSPSGPGCQPSASAAVPASSQSGIPDAGKLRAVPVDFAQAAEFVRLHHRHHTPPVGHKFSIGAAANEELVGVVIVGRPVARRRDDGVTLEVTRLCTTGHPNACSFLYGAAARAAFALGYKRIGTYILKREPGTSLAAAGWKLVAETPGRSWSVPSRRRDDKHPLEPRLLFEKDAA